MSRGRLAQFLVGSMLPGVALLGQTEVPICNVRGFKIENGRLVKLMVPGPVSTAIMGVNDKGRPCGLFSEAGHELLARDLSRIFQAAPGK